MTADFIFIPFGNRFKKISFATLLYIQQEKGRTTWVTTEGNFNAPVSLTQVQNKLPSRLFCIVHDAYIVALGKIISFDNKMLQLPGRQIPLHKKYVHQLMDCIRIIDPHPFSNLTIDSDGRLHNGSKASGV